MSEDEIERLAVEELMKEAKRGAERAKDLGASGWAKPPVPPTNKRFLTNTILSTLTTPKRRKRSHSSSSSEDGRRSSHDRRKSRRSETDYSKRSRDSYRYGGHKRSHEKSRKRSRKSSESSPERYKDHKSSHKKHSSKKKKSHEDRHSGKHKARSDNAKEEKKEHSLEESSIADKDLSQKENQEDNCQSPSSKDVDAKVNQAMSPMSKDFPEIKTETKTKETSPIMESDECDNAEKPFDVVQQNGQEIKIRDKLISSISSSKDCNIVADTENVLEISKLGVSLDTDKSEVEESTQPCDNSLIDGDMKSVMESEKVSPAMTGNNSEKLPGNESEGEKLTIVTFNEPTGKPITKENKPLTLTEVIAIELPPDESNSLDDKLEDRSKLEKETFQDQPKHAESEQACVTSSSGVIIETKIKSVIQAEFSELGECDIGDMTDREPGEISDSGVDLQKNNKNSRETSDNPSQDTFSQKNDNFVGTLSKHKKQRNDSPKEKNSSKKEKENTACVESHGESKMVSRERDKRKRGDDIYEKLEDKQLKEISSRERRHSERDHRSRRSHSSKKSSKRTRSHEKREEKSPREKRKKKHSETEDVQEKKDFSIPEKNDSLSEKNVEKKSTEQNPQNVVDAELSNTGIKELTEEIQLSKDNKIELKNESPTCVIERSKNEDQQNSSLNMSQDCKDVETEHLEKNGSSLEKSIMVHKNTDDIVSKNSSQDLAPKVCVEDSGTDSEDSARQESKSKKHKKKKKKHKHKKDSKKKKKTHSKER